MNIENFIKQELKNLIIEQKIDHALRSDAEIQKIILNEVDPNQDSKNMSSMGMYPTPGEAYDATIKPLGDWIWKQLERTIEPDVKYSDRGARIVWSSFMTFPQSTRSGRVRPAVIQNFKQKEASIISASYDFIKDEICENDEPVINKEKLKNICEFVKEQMQDKFEHLQDEYFRDFDRQVDALDQIWKTSRLGLEKTLRDKISGKKDGFQGFKLTKPLPLSKDEYERIGDPGPKVDYGDLEEQKDEENYLKYLNSDGNTGAAFKARATGNLQAKSQCQNAMRTVFTKDMIKFLMICVLDIDYSNSGAVSRGDIAKFPNLEKMISYYSDEFTKKLSDGSLDPRRVQQFKSWVTQTQEKLEEDQKTALVKGVETLGMILLFLLPFQIGRGAQAASYAARLLQISPKVQAAVVTSLAVLDGIELTLFLGMVATDLWNSSKVKIGEIISQLEAILEKLPGKEDVPQGSGKTSFDLFQEELRKNPEIESEMLRAVRLIEDARNSILKSYSQVFNEKPKEDPFIELMAKYKNIKYFNDSIEIITRQSSMNKREKRRQRSRYFSFRDTVANSINIYKNLGPEIKERLFVEVDRRTIKRKPSATKTEIGPDGTTITRDRKSGKILNTRPPNPKVQMMDMLEEDKKVRSEKISRYFRAGEFKCKDGTPVPPNLESNMKELANNLDKIRKVVGPLGITSGYRTPKYNARIEGATKSQHLLAKAADIVPGRGNTNTIPQIYKIINDLMDKGNIKPGGLGYYDNFVHYDTTGKKVVWGDKTKIAAALKVNVNTIKTSSGATVDEKESDSNKTISSYIIAAPKQTSGTNVGSKATTACPGSNQIIDSMDIQQALSFVVKGGNYCDYGNNVGAARDRNTYSRIESAVGDSVITMPPRDYAAREVGYSNDIKNSLWENFEKRHATMRTKETENTFQKVKSAIFKGMGVIYGLNIGGLEASSYGDRSNVRNVFNIGYVHHTNGKKPFIYASNAENWSRTSKMLEVSDEIKAIADINKKFNSSIVVSSEKRMLDTLNSLNKRSKSYKKFLIDNKFRFKSNSKRNSTRLRVISTIDKLTDAISLFINRYNQFKADPANGKISSLMGPGYVISTLAESIDFN